MHTYLRWNPSRTVAMVQSDAGPPYIGVIRWHELDEAWVATSSLYEQPQQVGVFAGPEDAHLALVVAAESLLERRRKSEAVAKMKRAA